MYIYTNNNYINSYDPNGKGLFGIFIGMAVALTAIVINANIVKNKAKKEIQKVQNDNYKKEKITNQNFEKTLHINAQNVKNKTQNMNFAEKLNYIAKTSDNNTENDLKRQEEWKTTVIYYDNHWMEPQDIGNYHFGYIGRAAGIPTSILTTGAGVIQFRDHGLKTMQNCFTDSICDDPRDTYYIRLGAIAYDQGY